MSVTGEKDRRVVADKAFENYDFGDAVVKDTGAWQQDDDEWTRPVYFENGDEPSTRETFVVRFAAGTATMTENYVSGWQTF